MLDRGRVPPGPAGHDQILRLERDPIAAAGALTLEYGHDQVLRGCLPRVTLAAALTGLKGIGLYKGRWIVLYYPLVGDRRVGPVTL
jgi:hypothetical protein